MTEEDSLEPHGFAGAGTSLPSVRLDDAANELDLAVVGSGAAGLMAAIWAGRTARSLGATLKIAAFDGAAKLGAKILVAGGGRCNVTHHAVSEADYAGSSRAAIRKVLLRFPVEETVLFFKELNVELKQEETGKLFPVTDRARTVLDALLHEAGGEGVEFVNPCRVERVEPAENGFVLGTSRGEWHAKRVILATGGRALPRSGSDGAGFEMARHLGHTITDYTFPSLVPLLLPKEHWLLGLSGIAAPVTMTVCEATGKRHETFTNPMLVTHFGLSGPVVLDISRYLTGRLLAGERVELRINWLPETAAAELNERLQAVGRGSVGRWLAEKLPERLARGLIESCRIDPSRAGHTLKREERRALLLALSEMSVPVTGDRGFTFAEATAGGVPLREVALESMGSRKSEGLHLCGEILDVDGRVGGFNFQWAWASGFVAGSSAARSVVEKQSH